MRQVTAEEQQALKAHYHMMNANTEFVPTDREFVELHETPDAGHHLLPSHGEPKPHTEVIELIPHDINGKIMRVYYSEKLNKCWVYVG